MRAVTSGDRGARRRSIEWSRVALAGLLCLVSVALGVVRPRGRQGDRRDVHSGQRGGRSAPSRGQAARGAREAPALLGRELPACRPGGLPGGRRAGQPRSADGGVLGPGAGRERPERRHGEHRWAAALVTKLDGKAIDVDPAPHVFRFEAVGQAPVEKTLVIVEGEEPSRAHPGRDTDRAARRRHAGQGPGRAHPRERAPQPAPGARPRGRGRGPRAPRGGRRSGAGRHPGVERGEERMRPDVPRPLQRRHHRDVRSQRHRGRRGGRRRRARARRGRRRHGRRARPLAAAAVLARGGFPAGGTVREVDPRAAVRPTAGGFLLRGTF